MMKHIHITPASYGSVYRNGQMSAMEMEFNPIQPPSLWRQRLLVVGLTLMIIPIFVFAASRSRFNLANTTIQTGTHLEESAISSMFIQFCNDHQKVYSSEEEKEFRFKVFQENLQLIKVRNDQEIKNGGTAVHGITMFSDLTTEEFSKRYFGSMERTDLESNSHSDSHSSSHSSDVLQIRTQQIERATSIPVEITNIFDKRQLSSSSSSTSLAVRNWANSYTTPVKDQGTCGCCYAFGAVEQLETDAIRKKLLDKNTPLSTQQIVACNTNYPAGGGECNGGNAQMALNWVETAGGLMYEIDYPYESSDGVTPSCTYMPNSPDGMISLSSVIEVSGEDAMLNHVLHTGPLAARFFNSELIQTYTSGVFAGCPTSSSDKGYAHVIQITGVNTDATPPYWIIRNSWSSRWGLDGYFYIKYGVNMCGLSSGFYTDPLLANSKAPTSTPTKNPNPNMNTHKPTAKPTFSAAPSSRNLFESMTAVTFNGNHKVEYPNGLGFSLTKTFSIALWVRTTSKSGTQVLVSIGSQPGAWGGFDVLLIGGALGILDSCSNGAMTFLPDVNVATGVRTHIALVKKGAKYNVFVNGKSYVFTVAAGDCAVYKTDNLYLGWDPAINCWFTGTIDCVHVFNTLIRQEFVQGLYETESAGPPAVPSLQPTGVSMGDNVAMLGSNTIFDGTTTIPANGMITLPFTFINEFSITMWFTAGSIINTTPNYLGLVQIDKFVLVMKNKKLGILESCAGSLGMVLYPLNANQRYFFALSKTGRDYKFCYNGGTLCGVLKMGMDCTYDNKAAIGEGDARLQSISQDTHFVGSLSKVTIYNKALSQEQIQQIKNEGP
mmetsp:Transcript_39554/g.40311  ORF Transcript_39554/g.40311 Transcript_39554/m.40311 type:complete len:832 (+) Transcript_39554:136-2631(+)